MNGMEILAPAGGEDQLIAAVRSGADAVYLGLNKFNARANAHNFANAKDVVSYCHARGVKVHITLNTLIKDEEIPELINTIREVAESGADAVIVQDLATAYLARSIAPSLHMHASTQMTVHNLDGVKTLEKLGFSRVVLARELTLKEIEYICNNTDMEVEVFVHGALCMCASGSCYMSSVLGERSGNRGYCAQPCRLNFECNGRNYALSLKDMCSIPYIEKLKSAGVVSLKIEGRMKRPEYVSAAVDSCIKGLNGAEPDYDLLRSVFSRSGFTDGYISNRINGSMFGYRQKEDVVSAGSVYKTIRNNYKSEYGRIPLDMTVTVKRDVPSKLVAVYGNVKAEVMGAIPEPAVKMSISNDNIGIQLAKTGGTQFKVNKIEYDIDEGLYLSKEDINSLRRKALDIINAELSAVVSHGVYDCPDTDIVRYNSLSKPKVIVRCENICQALELTDSGRIMLPVSEILKNPDAVDIIGDKIIAVLPQLKWINSNNDLLELKKLGIRDVLTDNIWAVYPCLDLGFTVHGGHGLNAFNSIAVNEYRKLGVSDIIVSFEQSLRNIVNLNNSVPKGVIAYGKLPLMQVRSCPARHEDGCRDCDGNPVLKDRYGNEFPIICHNRQYSTILNPVPLDLRGKKVENIDFAVLWFTDEKPKDCADVYRSYISDDFERLSPNGKFTRGLYYKNVL